MILRPWSAVRLAALALACALPAASAHASLTGLGEVRDSIPELTTALPRGLPGPCEGALCDELEAPQPKTRVRGFELDLYCRLGGEGDLSCRPRQVWLERYDGSASERSVFTGHYFDTETQLYYAKARYFDPQLGRFLSQDSYLGQIDDPPSLHRYVYVRNEPTGRIDPSGHDDFDIIQRQLDKAERQQQQRDWCAANPQACIAQIAEGEKADRDFLTRAGGVGKAAAGVGLVLGSPAVAVNVEVPGAPVVGGAMFTYGMDLAHSGSREFATGAPDEPISEALVRTQLEKLGFSPKNAEAITKLGFTAFAATGGALSARTLAPVKVSQSALATEADTAPSAGPPARPTWQAAQASPAEDLAGFGFKPEPSYLGGKPVPYGTKGSVRPDYASESIKLSVDVKDYGVTTPQGRWRLVKDVVGQTEARAANLPQGMRQGVIIDLRGQEVSDKLLQNMLDRIVKKSNGQIRPDDIVVRR